MVRPSRVIAIVIGVVVLVGLAAGITVARSGRVERALFSDEPMERYLAERIVLDRRISGTRLDPPAALSSASWSAVVEVLGTDPQAPNGCDIYLRYYAGHPGVGDATDTPAAAQAGFAVARVEDPDEPSGPVSFRFPRDGSLWEADMRELMPERHWRGARPGDFSDLETLWRTSARE